MSIQLVDNFYLNSSTPLDNRFVVGSQSFYTNRHDIDWKYVGMRVWDLNDGIPYVWDGSTYSSENSVSISGSGTVNKIPKFTTSTTVTDSLIYDDGTYVGIGNTTPVYELDVTGNIRSSVGFFGDGSNITNINADNITSGTLLLNRISNSSNTNWLLTSGVGGPGQSSWVNPTAVTVGNSTNATNATNATNTTNVNVTSYSTSTTSYLLFANATGNTSVYLNTTYSPKVNPSNGRVIIGNSTAFTSQLRVVASSTPTFDTLTVGYATAYNNFKVAAYNNNTQISLSRFLLSGASQSSSWASYGNPYDYDAISFAGRTYINANGSGTSDSRLISFGGGGTNDQIRFYMIGNSTTVPTVGGYGVYIEGNLQVNGTFSANKIKMPYGVGASFSSDALAAAGGIALGQLYHSNGTVKVRIV